MTGLVFNLKASPVSRNISRKKNKYVVKKSATLTPVEMNEVLLHLKDKNTPTSNVHGISIALLYFGLLRANEARQVEVDDVEL